MSRACKAEYRNEAKTRLNDTTYDALQNYKALHGLQSDSAAMAHALERYLFGAVGSLPRALVDVSARPAKVGTERAA
ncbi:hypothetical protein [Chitinimonas naiadis]